MAAVRSLSAHLAPEKVLKFNCAPSSTSEKPRVLLQKPFFHNVTLNGSPIRSGGAFPQVRKPYLGNFVRSQGRQFEDQFFPAARTLRFTTTGFRCPPLRLKAPSSLIFALARPRQSISSPSGVVSSSLSNPEELAVASESSVGVQETPSQDSSSAATGGYLESSAPTKLCVDCGRMKALRQFQEYRRRPDGHHDRCRACLARFKARRSKKELHHLGLSIEESWNQGKKCTRCKVFQEAGDFARYRTGLQCWCRSCTHETKKLHEAVNDSIVQQCSGCNVVKPTSEFGKSRYTKNGLYIHCRSCASARRREHISSIKKIYAPVVEKVCSICGVCEPATQFYPHRISLDGLQSQCKPCHFRYKKNHRGAVAQQIETSGC